MANCSLCSLPAKSRYGTPMLPFCSNRCRDLCANHILGEYWQDCWHCGGRTRWIELSFEAALHPGPCSTAKWAEFDAAQVGDAP